MNNKLRTAIMGCGQISGIYLKNLTGPFSKWIDVVACADLIRERAENRAKEFGVPAVMEPEDVYVDNSIELIVCLTDAPAHHYVCSKALANKKHAYTEKTFGIELAQGAELLRLARENDRRVGGAPDTFLGAGLQTARRLVQDGWIGEPVSAVASLRRRVNTPVPQWLWQPGAGPLFDMGPYYLTALISILGPVDSVMSMNKITFPQRPVILPDGSAGIDRVETPTHVNGMLRFGCGVEALLTTSFDVWDGQGENRLEINGTDGTVILPDPNTFGGPVLFYGKHTKSPVEIPLLYDFTENSRGLGVTEMAMAIRQGERGRAEGQLGYHVLETAVRILESGEQGGFVKVESSLRQPPAMPANAIDILCADRSLNGE